MQDNETKKAKESRVPQCLSIDIILDPPYFSLDTILKVVSSEN